MNAIKELIQSIEDNDFPPEGVSAPVQALWHTRKGNWDTAHQICQDIDSPLGSWIHAHLHVIEGDLGNAGYWYARAGKPAASPGELDHEWEELAEASLREG